VAKRDYLDYENTLTRGGHVADKKKKKSEAWKKEPTIIPGEIIKKTL
jgi:hypothetical protein